VLSIVVVVDLCPLVEVLGVLDRQRMELEDVAQDLEISGLRPVEVKPEELSGREDALDRFPAEVDLALAGCVEDVALRRLSVAGQWPTAALEQPVDRRFTSS
jgi:hypothetical protein